MDFIELLLIAIGLSMDAFAVSICKGLSACHASPRNMVVCGLYFGGFQGAMPLLGWALGIQFQSIITSIDHWIAFGLLGLLGIQMIRASAEPPTAESSSFAPSAMLPLAVATSIDALAVGITFAFLQVDILPAVAFIAITTCVLSALGVYLGGRFGGALGGRAELLGGLILIGIGIKILAEHLLHGA